MLRLVLLCILLGSYAAGAPDAGKVISGRCDDGTGTYLYRDLSVYTGSWKEGKRHGEGVIHYTDGSELRGGFAEDRPHGFALYLLPDGKVKGIRFNRGRILTSSFMSDFFYEGSVYGEYSLRGVYSGWYKGGPPAGYKPHGRGIMKWDDGSEYSGEWREGKIDGRGTMIWDNGARYSGQWEDGKRSGIGIFSSPEGTISKGRWRDNSLIQPLF